MEVTNIAAAFSSKAERDVVQKLYEDILEIRQKYESMRTLLEADSRTTIFCYVPDEAAINVVHAAHASSGANTFPGPITQPDMARNLVVAFSEGWDGGAVTVNGKDALGNTVSEQFAYTGPGAETPVGSYAFSEVTSITKATIGEDGTASVGTGTWIGINKPLADNNGILLVAKVPETVSVQVATNLFIPTTAPNGAKLFVLAVNIDYVAAASLALAAMRTVKE